MPASVSRRRFRSLLSRWRASARTRAHHAVLVVNPAAFSGRTGSPADFAAWAERGLSRTGGVPEAWRTRTDLPIPSPARVGVVLHVHYPELIDEILDGLRAIPVPFDLIVTNSSGSAVTIAPGRVPGASAIVVLDVENRGRDILPLVSLVNAGLLDAYHLILKVHTKRSDWREDHADLPGTGRTWRARLLGDLLGDAANVRAVIDAFATTPDLGLVTGDGSLLHAEFWGDNQSVAAELLRRLELELRPDELAFAAGSMYWVRGFVLQGLRAFDLTPADFEAEAGQVNATTAHAVERIVGIVAREAGLTVTERSALPPPAAASAEWARFDPGRALRPRARLVPFYLPQFHPIAAERPVVGSGVHRMEQCRGGPSRLSRASPAQAPDGHGVLRPPPRGHGPPPGLARPGGGHRRVDVLLLLVRRAGAP